VVPACVSAGNDDDEFIGIRIRFEVKVGVAVAIAFPRSVRLHPNNEAW
jgi:hypothetical protein